MAEKYMLEVQKRTWYEWAAWVVWFALEVFLYQSATSSGAELEPRAATIFWVSFFVLLVGGIVVWFLRRNK